MTREPATAPRTSGVAGLGKDLTEDLIFHGFQARFLEDRVRELSEAGEVDPSWSSFAVDVRPVVMSRAMRPTADGTGDVCHPGAHAPGPALAFGATALEFLRHLGRTGTHHGGASARLSWTDERRGLIGWGGRSGRMTQVLAGAALAFRRRGEDRAALAFEGSNALDCGGWHEGMNLAGALRVPLIVVVDVAMPDDAGPPGPDIRAIARGYGFAFDAIGQDSFADLVRAIAAARRRAVEGEGPTLLQLVPQSDLPRWTLHEEFLDAAADQGGSDRSEIERIERAARAGVDHAVARMTQEPLADPQDALVRVLTDAEPTPPWVRRDLPRPGRDAMLQHGTPDVR